MCYFTQTATDSGDVRLPLNLVSERAREGRGRRGVVSLPPSLSSVAGISIHKKPTGALLWRRFRRGRQEQGGVGSRRRTRFLRLRMARPLQKNTTVTTDAARVPVQVQVQVQISPLVLFVPNLSLRYESTSRLGIWLRFFFFVCLFFHAPHLAPHVPADPPITSAKPPLHPPPQVQL